MERVSQNFNHLRKIWLVVYTKSRCEKKVAERLMQEGFEAYCPTLNTIKKWSDRKKKIEEPMLRSYCFVKCNEMQRPEIFNIPGFVRFVYWLGKPVEISEKEIARIKRILKNYSADSIKIETLLPGETMEIQTGNFKGVKAVLKEVKGNKLILTFGPLGFKITVDTTVNRVARVKAIAAT